MTSVLITDPQPTFHPTLDQPEPATDAEVDKINESEMDKVNDVLCTWDPATGNTAASSPEKPKKSRTRLAVKSKPSPQETKEVLRPRNDGKRRFFILPRKSRECEYKSDDEATGSFTLYAVTSAPADRQGDIIQPGRRPEPRRAHRDGCSTSITSRPS